MPLAMKFRFKVQTFQTDAVDAVVDCFKGQPPSNGLRYRIDPGAVKAGQTARLMPHDRRARAKEEP